MRWDGFRGGWRRFRRRSGGVSAGSTGFPVEVAASQAPGGPGSATSGVPGAMVNQSAAAVARATVRLEWEVRMAAVTVPLRAVGVAGGGGSGGFLGSSGGHNTSGSVGGDGGLAAAAAAAASAAVKRWWKWWRLLRGRGSRDRRERRFRGGGGSGGTSQRDGGFGGGGRLHSSYHRGVGGTAAMAPDVLGEGGAPRWRFLRPCRHADARSHNNNSASGRRPEAPTRAPAKTRPAPSSYECALLRR